MFTALGRFPMVYYIKICLLDIQVGKIKLIFKNEYTISLYSILFKSNLENSSIHKNFLNWAAYLGVSNMQIYGQFEEFLWLDEFSNLLLSIKINGL